MADEGDSKSLVLITRVGSTPTTGIKKETLQLVWRVFFFICGVCAGRTARPESLTKNAMLSPLPG